MSTITDGVVNTKRNEIYFAPEETFVCDKGLGEELFTCMQKWSTHVAQIDAVTGKKETYAELQSKAIRTAQNMRLKGIKPGDVISSLTYNNLHYVAPILASLYIGAINGPMDPTTTLIDITHCLKLTTPKLVFCEEDLESTVEEAVKLSQIKTVIVVFGETDRNTPYSDFLIPREPEDTFQIYKVSDVKSTAFILFSSGTSGLQKAVCLNHYGLLFVGWKIVSKLPNNKSIIVVMSPFWIANINLIVSTITSGDTRVLVKIFDINTTLQYASQYKVNIISLTPVIGIKIIEKREEISKYDFSKLWFVTFGGAKLCPKQLLEYMKIFPGAKVVAAYGMTESAGILLNLLPQTAEELQVAKDVCIGTPIPGWRYKVVDTDTEKSTGPNENGELRVKFEGVLNSYYRNPEASASAFDSEGYLKTGDIVRYTEDYRFFYVTRFKDIFKFKGFHISPMLIEVELMNHPNIKQAVAFGFPVADDSIDNLPTAVIVVKDTDKHNDQDVISFMEERVPERYQLLGGVYVVDEMPSTSTGKIQRRKLLEIVQKLKKAA